MTKDFAKNRTQPMLERNQLAGPSAFSLFITGLVLGVVIGVFGCAVLYLSGNFPPFDLPVVANNPSTPEISAPSTPPTEDEQPLQFEFYTELPRYEVAVEASPVDLEPENPNPEFEQQYMLQTGAFRLRNLAETEMVRQQLLGHEATIRQQDLVGRTLYLLQSGPYSTQSELNAAEQLLRSHNIESTRMTLQ